MSPWPHPFVQKFLRGSRPYCLSDLGTCTSNFEVHSFSCFEAICGWQCDDVIAIVTSRHYHRQYDRENEVKTRICQLHYIIHGGDKYFELFRHTVRYTILSTVNSFVMWKLWVAKPLDCCFADLLQWCGNGRYCISRAERRNAILH